MKIKLGPITPGALPGVRNHFYIRDTMFGPRAQAWPRPGARQWTKEERQYQTRFAFAARMAANPFPTDYLTAVEMAKGTEQVPRDILTMAALGRYYEIVSPDGTTWGHVSGPIAPQPTPDSEVNTMWEWARWSDARTASYDGGGQAFKGILIKPYQDDTILGVRGVVNAVNGATYAACVAEFTTPSNIVDPTTSPSWTASGAGNTVLDFPLSKQIAAGKQYLVMVGRTDGGDTYALPIRVAGGTQWVHPYPQTHAVSCPHAAPANGDSCSTTLGVSAAIAVRFKEAT